MLPARLACKLGPQLREVDLAEVHGKPLGMVVTRCRRADCLIDDSVQLLEHLGHVSRVAPFLQLLVNGPNIVVALCIGKGARLHQQRLESDKHLASHDLEPASRLVRRVERVHGIPQGFYAIEPGGAA